MASVQKIKLASSRDIPFNKLVLSQANVRHVKAGVSVDELAEDIARRGLLQGLSVRAVVDEAGAETGMFEIPAGGRRYRALERLVKQKRLAKTAPVPCVVREDGIAEEDSLAENVQRAPLHPLDQFRAFQTLREKGQSEEEIAAAFFVAVSVVKQRLKLATVSPKLLEFYAGDALTLDQLMAFTVSDDHERQEQVHEMILQSHDRYPHAIRRLLTQNTVRAADKRALFVGIDAYVEAGGSVTRDLFESDQGGWLQDVALLDRMVAEKLKEAALSVKTEGWKWLDAAPSFPYGHTYGLRQLRGEALELTDEEESARSALQAEFDALQEQYDSVDELPEAVDERFSELETALTVFENRPMRYEADDIAHAGVFVSIDGEGQLVVERGYVRPEDERPADSESGDGIDSGHTGADAQEGVTSTAPSTTEQVEPEEDDGMKAIPDRLMAELTAHRTIGLRHALGEHPDVAFRAVLHALCLRLFYHYGLDTCLELDVKSAGFTSQAPGLADSVAARAIEARHQGWSAVLPKEPEALWEALGTLSGFQQHLLFAHCVAQSVNAVAEPYNRRSRAIAHADRLAEATGLDMRAAGWVPTVESYFGRVTKARILGAVREACGEAQAQLIDHLKKGEMAAKAEELLQGSSWLPEPLRTPGQQTTETAPDADDQATGEETAAIGGESAMGEEAPSNEDEDAAGTVLHDLAAE